MQIKSIVPRGSTAEELLTEILFEIATAHADGVELIRIEISEGSAVDNRPKVFSSIIRRLKQMKQRGQIQFFATPDSFLRSSTEAVFLLNKYPVYFDGISKGEIEKYIYIKI